MRLRPWLVLLSCACVFARAEEPRPAAQDERLGTPLLVQTVPAAFEDAVDPQLTGISVTFDRPMRDQSWSWTGGGDTMPKSAGEIRYDAAKTTCTRPVQLEPGKVYWVGVNSPSHRHFQTPEGVPAAWHVILFATASEDGKPTRIPKDLLEQARKINGPAIPVIVKTVPEAFAEGVDPKLDRIAVTFNRPMRDGSWSWTGGGETYPKVSGAISYDEAKTTCTLPVQLEPAKVYWVGVNSPSHRNFKAEDRVPARWHVILFATAAADGKPTPIPADLLEKARKINGARDAR